jgi:Protein of unknown function (DUF1573)
MNLRPFPPALVLSAVFAVQPLVAAPATPAGAGNSPAPQITFATPVYNFGKLASGALVKYSFVFTNTGDALLVVSNVQPSCGCTTAEPWSKEVDPGKIGIIPIQFSSGALSGPVTKAVTVTSNDKTHPWVRLQITGTLWKAIDVSPQYAVLNVQPESASNATTVLRIVNNLDQPLSLSQPECNNRAFSAELKTNQPGKEFQLTVTAVPPVSPTNTQGLITLKTSSTNIPILNIMAVAMLQPAVVVYPPRVTLPAGPLATIMTTVITIRYNGTNYLSLSNAVVNAEGVQAQINDTEPGHGFAVNLAFPKGFEAASVDNLALTVNSSHPQFPRITVPISQPLAPIAIDGKLAQPPTAHTNRPPLASRPSGGSAH